MTEPWQWDEAEWRKRVAKVRAGRRLMPKAWPGGARCAVALSFDSDHETNELRDGGTSIGRMSWGQYGARQGIPRILAALAKSGIPATFFVPAVTALLHPEEQHRVIGEGHEIGLHGWIHEKYVDEALFLMVTHDVNPRAMSAKVKGFVQAQNWFQNFSSITMAP